jgi:HEAT repeat protein
MRYGRLAAIVMGVLWIVTAAADDTAARLFDEARRELNRDDFREAAERFEKVWNEYADSDHAGPALYWYAFALYRIGATDDLHLAQRALERVQSHYREAATLADAQDLATRIRGELARRGDAEAAQRLAELAADLDEPSDASRAPDPDDDLRLAALSALLHMDSDRAIPILKSVLQRRGEESKEMRERAVFLVSQKQTDESAEILVDVVRNDPDPEVRAQAVHWLSQVAGDEAVDVLEEILTTSSDQELQENALFALSQHHSERAAKILMELVANERASRKTRETAIYWLGQRRSSETFQFLKELYHRLEEQSLKEGVIFSMSQMEEMEAGDWLFDIALDESEPMELRRNALHWAGQKTRIPVEKLRSLYDTLDHREIKEQLIFVLSQRQDKAAVDMMLEIARSESDMELRKQAIFWLSQTKDPRVADFLEEIISQ